LELLCFIVIILFVILFYCCLVLGVRIIGIMFWVLSCGCVIFFYKYGDGGYVLFIILIDYSASVRVVIVIIYFDVLVSAYLCVIIVIYVAVYLLVYYYVLLGVG